jgi:hypothetical protein
MKVHKIEAICALALSQRRIGDEKSALRANCVIDCALCSVFARRGGTALAFLK